MYLDSKPAAKLTELTENRIALCPKSKDEMKNYEDATKHAANLYYEKRVECEANGTKVPYGFV
jgi:hypothetical protein